MIWIDKLTLSILVLEWCKRCSFDSRWDDEYADIGFVEISNIFGIQDEFFVIDLVPCDGDYIS